MIELNAREDPARSPLDAGVLTGSYEQQCGRLCGVLPRPDLRLLAARLGEREPGPAHWTADGPGALTPHLQVDRSELPPEVVRAELESLLATAPAAWDPYLVSR